MSKVGLTVCPRSWQGPWGVWMTKAWLHCTRTTTLLLCHETCQGCRFGLQYSDSEFYLLPRAVHWGSAACPRLCLTPSVKDKPASGALRHHYPVWGVPPLSERHLQRHGGSHRHTSHKIPSPPDTSVSIYSNHTGT